MSPDKYLLSLFYLDGERIIRKRSGREVRDNIKPRYNTVSYVNQDGEESSVGYHRLKFALRHGHFPRVVDHRDRNTRNNLLDNLRAANHSSNLHNCAQPAHGLPRGVYRHGKRFRARVVRFGKRIHLGVFDTPEEASAVVEAAQKEHYGSSYEPNRIRSP